MEKPLVSVVIPSYRSADTIEKTLAALSSQEGDISYEVIVVNSSSDRTPDLVRTTFPQVKLLQREERTSAGEARNIGAALAAGTYLAFVDADCVVVRNWMRSCLERLSADAAAIGGPIENANPESLVSSAGHILEFSQFYTRSGLRIVEHVPSGNIFMRKKTFDAVGGYPTELFPQEDRYFSWKLRRATGKNLLFHESIAITHHHRTSLREFLAHQALIGSAGAEILRHTDLPGSGIIRRRWLAVLLAPAFALTKLARSVARTLRWKPRDVLRRPHVLPLLGLGMFYWMLGFARQADRREP